MRLSPMHLITPTPKRPTPGRQGAALILAMIILAALMLIGLPFALSQSYSVSGTMNYRAGNSATIGRDNAEGLGIAAAVYANDLATRTYALQVNANSTANAVRIYNALDQDLIAALDSNPTDNNGVLESDLVYTSLDHPGRVDVRLRSLELAPKLNPQKNTTTTEDDLLDRITTNLSMSIEDESGRLDPNNLDALGWAALLETAGIIDWDDDQVKDTQPWPNMIWDSQSASNIQNTDPATDDEENPATGELAEALAQLRYSYPNSNYRITSLDQLLEADPGHNTKDPASAPSSITWKEGDDPNAFGFRRPLTRSELDRLRPYLSVHNRGQGRDGRIDMGTVITMDRAIQMTPNPEKPVFDTPPANTVSAGATLFANYRGRAWRFGSEFWHDPSTDDKIFAEVPAQLNINAASALAMSIALNAPELRETWPEGYFDSQYPNAPITPFHAATNDRPYPVTTYTDLLFDLDPAATASDWPYRWNSVVDNVLFAGLDPYRDPKRTMPPLGMRSFGLVRIEASASARNASEQPISARRRTTIAQALPAHRDLAFEWTTQGHFEHAARLGHTSNMVSWPHAMQRIQLVAPAEYNAAGSLDEDMKPQAYPTWAALGDNCPVEDTWTRPFGPIVGEQPVTDVTTALSTGKLPAAPTTPDLTATPYTPYPGGQTKPQDGIGERGYLTPDGLSMLDNAPLSYRLDATNSPFAMDNNSKEIRGRHVSLWVKPDEDWAGQTIAIVEMRGQPNSLIAPIGGQNTESWKYQNLWRLEYDGVNNYLVLYLANAAIEHPNDQSHRSQSFGTGLKVPDPLHHNDDYVFWDARSLGQDADGQSAPDGTAFTMRPLAPNVPEHGRRVAHYFKMDPGMQTGNWYHLQVMVAHSRPGGQKILVNGFAGRDLNTSPPTAGNPEHGDHVTTPSMRLETQLTRWQDNPFTTASATPGAILRDVPTITAQVTTIHDELGISLDDMFPERGTILIGNEVIMYQGLDDQSGGFLNCYRGGDRIETNAYGEPTWVTPSDPNKDSYWSPSRGEIYPILEDHLPGDLVVPAGARIEIPTDKTGPSNGLYIGGTTLSYTLGNGDPSSWGQIWGFITRETAAMISPVPYLIDTNTNQITLTHHHDNSGGSLDQFPADGYISIRGAGGLYVFYYNNPTYDPGQQTLSLDLTFDTAFGIDPSTLSPLAFSNDASDPPYSVAVPLISIKVPSQNIDNASGRQYFPNNQDGITYGYHLLQIEHPDTGRIEWLNYDDTKVAHGAGFFLFANGLWELSRGQQRTLFAPNLPLYANNPTAPEAVFPAGSQVLPVQTGMLWRNITDPDPNDNTITISAPDWDDSPHRLATGDAVTILPSAADTSSLNTTPFQMVIRYSPVDAHPIGSVIDPDPADTTINAAASMNNVRSELFAFTEPIPDGEARWNTLDNGNYEIITGIAWSGYDLSASDPVSVPRGAMPRMDGMGTNYTLASDPRVYLMADGEHGNESVYPATIDGLLSASQVDESVGISYDGELRELYDSNFTAIDSTTELASGPLGVDFFIKITGAGGNFFSSNGNGAYGLICINGEIAAYECVDPNDPNKHPDADEHTAKIIARGLFGSNATAWTISTNYRPKDTTDDITSTLSEYASEIRRGPAIIHLPLGPVTRFADSLPPANANESGRATALGLSSSLQGEVLIDDATTAKRGLGDNKNIFMKAPCHLAIKLDGNGMAEAYELLHITYQDSQWFTAPWLRGLYGGQVYDFGANDLIMAWWPRYPSALPPTPREEHYRCRRYTWAGFPLNLYDTRFINGSAIASFDQSTFAVELRALSDESNDWEDSPSWSFNSATQGPNGEYTLNFDFNTNSLFSYTIANGAELRMLWRYNLVTEEMSELTRRTGLGVEVEHINQNVRVPLRILGREGGR